MVAAPLRWSGRRCESCCLRARSIPLAMSPRATKLGSREKGMVANGCGIFLRLGPRKSYPAADGWGHRCGASVFSRVVNRRGVLLQPQLQPQSVWLFHDSDIVEILWSGDGTIFKLQLAPPNINRSILITHRRSFAPCSDSSNTTSSCPPSTSHPIFAQQPQTCLSATSSHPSCLQRGIARHWTW